MRVLKAEKSGLKHPAEPGCRVLPDWPSVKLYRKEHSIPRVSVPMEVRPPVECPRLMVSVTKPDGEFSERRAHIDDWGYVKAALIIQTGDEELIPSGSDVELLRYQV